MTLYNAPDLLEALQACLFALDEHEDGFGPSKQAAIKGARSEGKLIHTNDEALGSTVLSVKEV